MDFGENLANIVPLLASNLYAKLSFIYNGLPRQ